MNKIRKALKTQPVLEKVNNYKNKWIQHAHRTDRSRLPNASVKYQPPGKRNPGRPLKRLLDCYISKPEQATTPIESIIMMIMMMMMTTTTMIKDL
jgi:hypothetical protein